MDSGNYRSRSENSNAPINDFRSDPFHQYEVNEGYMHTRDVLPNPRRSKYYDPPPRHDRRPKRDVTKMGFLLKATFAFLICVLITMLVALGIFVALYFAGTTSSSSSEGAPSTVGTTTGVTQARPLSVQRTIFIGMNETAEITSPLYPNEYPNDVRITWDISTTEGKVILLAFESFSTDPGYDFLQLGESLQSLNSFTTLFQQSGSAATPVFRSQGSTVAVRFISDSTVSGRGFVIKIACIPSVVVSEEISLNSNETTTIHYPNYAKVWNIEADTNKIIRFDFVPSENQTPILIIAGSGRYSDEGNLFFVFQSSSRTSKTAPRFALSNGNEAWFAIVYFGASVDSGAPLVNVSSVSTTEHFDCYHVEFDCGRYCIPESWVCDRQPDCVISHDELAFCVN